jgi:diguanylate cyclase (GGDEF)-like protein
VKAPDIPDNEQARLQALLQLDILDTPAEERFDRLVRMARRLFDAPIALITLIDRNRQWFKASSAPDEVENPGEVPREITFCGHTIMEENFLVIPDALADARFSDNPMVCGPPNIRFYAGCSVTDGNRHNVGTLCIFDQKPRDFSAEDIRLLRDLAAMVESELAAIHMATVDELTNIANRRGFMAMAQHALQLCQRQNVPASLAFLDLNSFKQINDSFGHAEGDQALQFFAAQLRQHYRESDLCARLGGDEFVVLLTNTDLAQANELTRRLSDALQASPRQAQAEDKGLLSYQLSFSHGVVEYDAEKHAAIEDLLEEGDRLMYQHKKRC